jgi:hypothetical protein
MLILAELAALQKTSPLADFSEYLKTGCGRIPNLPARPGWISIELSKGAWSAPSVACWMRPGIEPVCGPYSAFRSFHSSIAGRPGELLHQWWVKRKAEQESKFEAAAFSQ